MKKSILIKMLSEIPGDPEVALVDYSKSEDSDLPEGTSAGIYEDFDLQLVPSEFLPHGMKRWIAIGFSSGIAEPLPFFSSENEEESENYGELTEHPFLFPTKKHGRVLP